MSVLANARSFKGICRVDFHIERDIRGFFENYKPRLQDLGHALTITGNSYNAQMTTIDYYLQQIWPHDSNAAIGRIQSAFLRQNSLKQENGIGFHR